MNSQKTEFDLSNEIDELSAHELDMVSGGGISLNFSRLEVSYHPQNADGSTKNS